LGIEKEEAIEELDFVRCAYAAVKIVEIGAAAERNVLAIVDVLTVGQDVRGGAATEEGTLFEETYAPAGLSQRDAGRQPR
jgi:hypothetical protein